MRHAKTEDAVEQKVYFNTNDFSWRWTSLRKKIVEVKGFWSPSGRHDRGDIRAPTGKTQHPPGWKVAFPGCPC